MKIAFVTTYNARSILNFSGIPYYISKSLEDTGNDVDYIGNLPQRFIPLNFLKSAFYTKILQRKFPKERTIRAATAYSHVIADRIKNHEYDYIFSPGTIPIAFLNVNVRKVIYTDSTFAGMLNYYNAFEKLSADSVRQGHVIEREALKSCALAIYPSHWAAQSAITDYQTDPCKVKVVPFGANWDTDYTEQQVYDFINRKDRTKLKILFNGVDWKRKGGDLVLSTVKEINTRGLDVELHIAGTRNLALSGLPGYVFLHGFLNKSIPKEKAKLEQLYQNAHFLFVPSKSEAFGCVFCEASLFGVPSVSRKTGGIVSAITDGRNGFTLDAGCTAHDYADLFCEYFIDHSKYASLAFSSYHEYSTRLNWKTAGQSISALMQNAMV